MLRSRALIAVLAVSCLAATQAATQVMVPNTALTDAMRSAVRGLRGKFGELQPWQQKVFDQEILANPQDYVREYRQVGDRYKIDVDQVLIQKFLAFHAPDFLGNAQPRFAVRVEADAGCSVCEAAAPGLRKLFQSKLEIRNAKAVWFKDEEMPIAASGGAPELPRLALLQSLETSRGLQGSLLVRIEAILEKDSETGAVIPPAHPEDAKFALRLGLAMAGGRTRVIRQVEFQYTEPVEPLARKLWLEVITELAIKSDGSSGSAALGAVGAGPAEVLLQVTGVRDYFMLNQLKSQVQLAVGEMQPVIERSLSRGRVVLAIRTDRSMEEIRGKISKVTLGPAGQLRLMLSSSPAKGRDGLVLEGEIR